MKKPIFTLTLFIVLASFLITSCKKKDSAEPDTQKNITTTIGGDYGTFVSTYNSYDLGNNIVYADSSVQAEFFDSPYSSHTNLSAGIVSVNGTTLNTISNYVYTSSQVNLSNLNWQISGSGTITANSFYYTPSYPIYTGNNSLPDTVIKANGFSFNLNNLLNTNTATYITIAQSGVSSEITRLVSQIPSVVTITASELQNFNIK